MPSFLSQFLRLILTVVLGLFAAVFAVSLLAAALIVVVLSLLKSLITGRKPAPAMVFGRFQRFSPQGMWPGRPAPEKPANPNAGHIVDVEAREVPEDRRQP
ncbi:MAG: hypothetical protein A3E79_04535 [Burkholderiales bacterium RIFCSPHIGHO2_12_FULL_61_11]|nr:MAG: hypothetical protein A3E79_04535 [Burkholderiales bacterium RIFCSPHIGHO2_12_FULL_61_11]